MASFTMRGSTPEDGTALAAVYRMRIDLLSTCIVYDKESLPRMRGDRPRSAFRYFPVSWFTPHARGSTFRKGRIIPVFYVYPACAGIDLFRKRIDIFPRRLPRMRGDRPRKKKKGNLPPGFTPHARGSTFLENRVTFLPDVYPACAGIDPSTIL